VFWFILQGRNGDTGLSLFYRVLIAAFSSLRPGSASFPLILASASAADVKYHARCSDQTLVELKSLRNQTEKLVLEFIEKLSGKRFRGLPDRVKQQLRRVCDSFAQPQAHLNNPAFLS
jgi:hypothetical protein